MTRIGAVIVKPGVFVGKVQRTKVCENGEWRDAFFQLDRSLCRSDKPPSLGPLTPYVVMHLRYRRAS